MATEPLADFTLPLRVLSPAVLRELAEKAGVDVRTIRRLLAGNMPRTDKAMQARHFLERQGLLRPLSGNVWPMFNAVQKHLRELEARMRVTKPE